MSGPIPVLRWKFGCGEGMQNGGNEKAPTEEGWG